MYMYVHIIHVHVSIHHLYSTLAEEIQCTCIIYKCVNIHV